MLELDICLVPLLGLLEFLGLGLFVRCEVFFLLLLIVGLEVLDLLLAVSSLQMIDALASNAELFAELVLLPLESLKLQDTDPLRVEIVQVLRKLNVNLGGRLELLDLLLHLLTLNALLLSLDALVCTLLLLFGQAASLLILDLLLADESLGLLLVLLGLLSLESSLLLLRDDVAASENLLVLLLGAFLGTLKSGLLVTLAFGVERRVDILASDEERLGKTGKLRSYNLGRGALETLHRAGLNLGGSSTRSRVHSLGR